MHPRVQVCLLPLSPPAMFSHCLAWANTGTASELTEKSSVSAMLVPFSSSPGNQDSPALAQAEEVPAEASSPAIAFAELYKRPLGIAQPKPMGSRFSAWHKLPSMPQTVGPGHFTRSVLLLGLRKASREQKQQDQDTKQSCKQRHMRDSHLILLFLFFFHSTLGLGMAATGSGWQELHHGHLLTKSCTKVTGPGFVLLPCAMQSPRCSHCHL